MSFKYRLVYTPADLFCTGTDERDDILLVAVLVPVLSVVVLVVLLVPVMVSGWRLWAKRCALSLHPCLDTKRLFETAFLKVHIRFCLS